MCFNTVRKKEKRKAWESVLQTLRVDVSWALLFLLLGWMLKGKDWDPPSGWSVYSGWGTPSRQVAPLQQRLEVGKGQAHSDRSLYLFLT